MRSLRCMVIITNNLLHHCFREEWLPIREYKRLHVSINPIIFDMLKDCSQRSVYTMNTLVNTALHDYLNDLDKCLRERGK